MKELGYTEHALFRKGLSFFSFFIIIISSKSNQRNQTKSKPKKIGRFRPATYWKPEKVSLAAPPAHKDRVLVTSFTFKPNNDNNDNDINDNNNEEPPKNLSKKEKARLEREKKEKEAKNVIHVVNVHLKTGSDQGLYKFFSLASNLFLLFTLTSFLPLPPSSSPTPFLLPTARRVRQFHEGVETAFKVAKKLGHPSPSSSPLIVCGDMNALEGDAVLFFAENGSIGPEWGGEGEKKVISKEKKLSIKLRDASLEGKGVREPPNTLVVRELVSLLEGGVGGEEGKGGLSEGVAEMLGRVFGRFATGEKGGEKVMVKGDVERWLKVVNMVVGRGSEFRWAVKKMRESLEYNSSSFSPTEEDDPPADSLPDNGFLTLSSFLAIHLEELNDGGCWGVAHNLYLLGELLPNKGLYKVRFDRVYVSEGLELCCVRDVVCEEACPNEREPSDHLPVGVEVKFK